VFVRPDNPDDPPCIAVVNVFSGNGATVPPEFLTRLETAIKIAVSRYPEVT